MFKQGLNQSGSGGRLVIPKNSKWSMAAGVCMIVALLFMLFFKPFLYYGCISLSFTFNIPPLKSFCIGLFSRTPLIESVLFFLFFIGGFIVFIITALIPQKNIKRYILPLCLFVISVALPYFSSPQSGFQNGIWTEFWLASKLAVFWGYLIFLISFLLFCIGKVSKRTATIICSCGIGFIWLMVLVNSTNVPPTFGTMFAVVSVSHTLILTAFLLALFNFNIFSKGGNKMADKISLQAQIEFKKRLLQLQKTDVNINEATEAKLFAMSVQDLSLKAPATAQYAPLDEITCIKENDFYIVSGYVDAQNSHGAMIRTPFKIKVKNENGEWKTITNPFMVASGRLGGQVAIYYVFGIVITLALFAFFYFIFNL